MCSKCTDTIENAPEVSVGDLLAFAAWPDELQRIARAALYDEMAGHVERQHRAVADARAEQRLDDEAAYEEALKVVARASLRLRALANDSRTARVAGLPESLFDVAKMLDAMPRELEVAL